MNLIIFSNESTGATEANATLLHRSEKWWKKLAENYIVHSKTI